MLFGLLYWYRYIFFRSSMGADVPTVEDMTLDSTPRSVIPIFKPEWKTIITVGQNINYYTTPVICFLGMFGNIFTFMIMSRQRFNKSSTSIYFRTLAVVDFFVLLSHVSTIWLTDVLPKRDHWLEIGYFLCRMRYTISGWSAGASAITLVAVTFERFLVTAIPLKAKQYCTRRNAKIVCVTINVVVFLFWFVPVLIVQRRAHCSVSRVYMFEYINKYGRWIYSFFYTYFTTPTIFLLNSFLVYRLIQARSSRLKMTSSTNTSQDSQAQYQRLTIMAVTVSIAYFVFTVPTTTVNLLANFLDKSRMSSYLAWMMFGHQISIVIRVSNHAINFLLYLMTNKRIEAEFRSMMCAPFAKLRRSVTADIKMSDITLTTTTGHQ